MASKKQKKPVESYIRLSPLIGHGGQMHQSEMGQLGAKLAAAAVPELTFPVSPMGRSPYRTPPPMSPSSAISSRMSSPSFKAHTEGKSYGFGRMSPVPSPMAQMQGSPLSPLGNASVKRNMSAALSTTTTTGINPLFDAGHDATPSRARPANLTAIWPGFGSEAPDVDTQSPAAAGAKDQVSKRHFAAYQSNPAFAAEAHPGECTEVEHDAATKMEDAWRCVESKIDQLTLAAATTPGAGGMQTQHTAREIKLRLHELQQQVARRDAELETLGGEVGSLKQQLLVLMAGQQGSGADAGAGAGGLMVPLRELTAANMRVRELEDELARERAKCARLESDLAQRRRNAGGHHDQDHGHTGHGRTGDGLPASAFKTQRAGDGASFVGDGEREAVAPATGEGAAAHSPIFFFGSHHGQQQQQQAGGGGASPVLAAAAAASAAAVARAQSPSRLGLGGLPPIITTPPGIGQGQQQSQQQQQSPQHRPQQQAMGAGRGRGVGDDAEEGGGESGGSDALLLQSPASSKAGGSDEPNALLLSGGARDQRPGTAGGAAAPAAPAAGLAMVGGGPPAAALGLVSGGGGGSGNSGSGSGSVNLSGGGGVNVSVSLALVPRLALAGLPRSSGLATPGCMSPKELPNEASLSTFSDYGGSATAAAVRHPTVTVGGAISAAVPQADNAAADTAATSHPEHGDQQQQSATDGGAVGGGMSGIALIPGLKPSLLDTLYRLLAPPEPLPAGEADGSAVAAVAATAAAASSATAAGSDLHSPPASPTQAAKQLRQQAQALAAAGGGGGGGGGATPQAGHDMAALVQHMLAAGGSPYDTGNQPHAAGPAAAPTGGKSGAVHGGDISAAVEPRSKAAGEGKKPSSQAGLGLAATIAGLLVSASKKARAAVSRGGTPVKSGKSGAAAAAAFSAPASPLREGGATAMAAPATVAASPGAGGAAASAAATAAAVAAAISPLRREVRALLQALTPHAAAAARRRGGADHHVPAPAPHAAAFATPAATTTTIAAPSHAPDHSAAAPVTMAAVAIDEAALEGVVASIAASAGRGDSAEDAVLRFLNSPFLVEQHEALQAALRSATAAAAQQGQALRSAQQQLGQLGQGQAGQQQRSAWQQQQGQVGQGQQAGQQSGQQVGEQLLGVAGTGCLGTKQGGEDAEAAASVPATSDSAGSSSHSNTHTPLISPGAARSLQFTPINADMMSLRQRFAAAATATQHGSASAVDATGAQPHPGAGAAPAAAAAPTTSQGSSSAAPEISSPSIDFSLGSASRSPGRLTVNTATRVAIDTAAAAAAAAAAGGAGAAAGEMPHRSPSLSPHPLMASPQLRAGGSGAASAAGGGGGSDTASAPSLLPHPHASHALAHGNAVAATAAATAGASASAGSAAGGALPRLPHLDPANEDPCAVLDAVMAWTNSAYMAAKVSLQEVAGGDQPSPPSSESELSDSRAGESEDDPDPADYEDPDYLARSQSTFAGRPMKRPTGVAPAVAAVAGPGVGAGVGAGAGEARGREKARKQQLPSPGVVLSPPGLRRKFGTPSAATAAAAAAGAGAKVGTASKPGVGAAAAGAGAGAGAASNKGRSSGFASPSPPPRRAPALLAPASATKAAAAPGAGPAGPASAAKHRAPAVGAGAGAGVSPLGKRVQVWRAGEHGEQGGTAHKRQAGAAASPGPVSTAGKAKQQQQQRHAATPPRVADIQARALFKEAIASPTPTAALTPLQRRQAYEASRKAVASACGGVNIPTGLNAAAAAPRIDSGINGRLRNQRDVRSGTTPGAARATARTGSGAIGSGGGAAARRTSRAGGAGGLAKRAGLGVKRAGVRVSASLSGLSAGSLRRGLHQHRQQQQVVQQRSGNGGASSSRGVGAAAKLGTGPGGASSSPGAAGGASSSHSGSPFKHSLKKRRANDASPLKSKFGMSEIANVLLAEEMAKRAAAAAAGGGAAAGGETTPAAASPTGGKRNRSVRDASSQPTPSLFGGAAAMEGAGFGGALAPLAGRAGGGVGYVGRSVVEASTSPLLHPFGSTPLGDISNSSAGFGGDSPISRSASQSVSVSGGGGVRVNGVLSCAAEAQSSGRVPAAPSPSPIKGPRPAAHHHHHRDHQQDHHGSSDQQHQSAQSQAQVQSQTRSQKQRAGPGAATGPTHATWGTQTEAQAEPETDPDNAEWDSESGGGARGESDATTATTHGTAAAAQRAASLQAQLHAAGRRHHTQQQQLLQQQRQEEGEIGEGGEFGFAGADGEEEDGEGEIVDGPLCDADGGYMHHQAHPHTLHSGQHRQQGQQAGQRWHSQASGGGAGDDASAAAAAGSEGPLHQHLLRSRGTGQHSSPNLMGPLTANLLGLAANGPDNYARAAYHHASSAGGAAARGLSSSSAQQLHQQQQQQPYVTWPNPYAHNHSSRLQQLHSPRCGGSVGGGGSLTGGRSNASLSGMGMGPSVGASGGWGALGAEKSLPALEASASLQQLHGADATASYDARSFPAAMPEQVRQALAARRQQQRAASSGARRQSQQSVGAGSPGGSYSAHAGGQSMAGAANSTLGGGGGGAEAGAYGTYGAAPPSTAGGTSVAGAGAGSIAAGSAPMKGSELRQSIQQALREPAPHRSGRSLRTMLSAAMGIGCTHPSVKY